MKRKISRGPHDVRVIGIKRKEPRIDLYVKALIEFGRQLEEEKQLKLLSQKDQDFGGPKP